MRRELLIAAAMGCASSPGPIQIAKKPPPPPVEAASPRRSDGYYDAAGLAVLEHDCGLGRTAACAEAGANYLEHPSLELRDGFRAYHWLRIACARGDAKSCRTIAIQEFTPVAEWPPEAKDVRQESAALRAPYANRGCRLGDPISCAIVVGGDATWSRFTPEQKQAFAGVEKACKAGDADACAAAIKLANDAYADPPLAAKELEIRRPDCDAGHGASCVVIAERFNDFYNSWEDAPDKSRLHYLRRACEADSVPACLAIVDIGTSLSDEFQHNITDPDNARLVTSKETACNAGNAGACAWRAQSLLGEANYATWEHRARETVASACTVAHHEHCDAVLGQLVDVEKLGDVGNIGLTLPVPPDDACKNGSFIACVITMATAFSENSEQRIHDAYGNAVIIGMHECGVHHVRCASRAQLLLSSTRHKTNLRPLGEDLARKMFEMACATPDTALACSAAADLSAAPEKPRLTAKYHELEGQACAELKAVCGGAQCDPACPN